MKYNKVFLSLCLVIMLASVSRAFFLSPGEKVVFYGDSITAQRLYTEFVENYVVTQFPGLDAEFVNSGYSEDKITGGRAGNIDVRLRRDVLAQKPGVVVLLFGMNDGGFKAYDENLFSVFAEGYRRAVETLKRGAPGVRLVAAAPSPFDDVSRPPWFPGGYNAVLVRYGGYLRELAKSEGLCAVDFNAPLVELLKAVADSDMGLAQKIIADRVHPSPGAHLVMAAALLKEWGAAVRPRSVEIDAGSGKLAVSGALVEGLTTGAEISWAQTDSTLPVPIDLEDETVAVALARSPLLKDWNGSVLRIAGLGPGRWQLLIDGNDSGDFDAAEFAAGVSLAARETPMRRQAAEVGRLTAKHNDIRMKAWRTVQLSMEDESPKVRAAADDLIGVLAEEEKAVVARQRAAAQPRPHKFLVRRLPGAPEKAPAAPEK